MGGTKKIMVARSTQQATHHAGLMIMVDRQPLGPGLTPADGAPAILGSEQLVILARL